MADPFGPTFMAAIRDGALADRGRDYAAQGELFRFDFDESAIVAAGAQVVWLSARTPPPSVAAIGREIDEAVADGFERAYLESRTMAYWGNEFVFEPWLARVLPADLDDGLSEYYSELWTVTLLRLEVARRELAARGRLVTA